MTLTSSLRSNSLETSSSKTPHHRHDVFLSFRGKDIRGNFLEYLYRALRQKGILSFKDDIKLKYGERISEGLFEAIEESKISIVVLSENYADSSWCLRELVRIIACKRDLGLVVYPVFYRVTPSNVLNQEGAFGEGFKKACLRKEEEEVTRWRDALEDVGNLRGWDYPNPEFNSEAELIDNLVHEIFDKSNDIFRITDEDLVGIRPRMMEVINLLDLGSDKTQIVGLWGMGGVGKTTLAKVVYDYISWQFEGCSFVDNVREVFERSGVLPLQQLLISDILKEENFRMQSAITGIRIIKNHVCRKKVLIVLDDVSNAKQVEDLVGKLQWFGHKSRIIITSRDKQVLDGCPVHDVFNVQKLDKDEAMKLFKSKAFGESGETGGFYWLVGRALQYADGVPLALKVLGSTLLGGTVTKWGGLLDRLGDSLDDELQKVLKISYDGLSWKDQQIFLDICCFFKGMSKDRVVKILDSCGFEPDFGIDVLVEKSLLTISGNNSLQMHDLVQKMGWTIIDEESRTEPGKRSRLWRPDEVKRILMDSKGTEKVECMKYMNPENLQLQRDSFAEMTNLRILTTRSAHSSRDIPRKLSYLQWVHRIFGPRCSIYLSNMLRLLEWDGYPFKCMPTAFRPEYLVELNLIESHIEQLWDRTMVLPKLTVMNLSSSTSLTNSPEFTGFPNLEDLVLQGCTALLDIDPSIKDLKKLKNLNLKGCTKLKTLPYGIKSQCIEVLNFSSCLKLENILECFEDLKRLRSLDLDETGITKLAESIGNSTNLMHLACPQCAKLESIPASIGQLKKLEKLSLERCSSLRKLPEEVGLIQSLLILDVLGAGIHELPASVVQLRNLQQLSFQAFFSEASPSTLQISNSTPLDFSGFSNLIKLDLIVHGLTSFPNPISLCISMEHLTMSGDFESLPVGIKDLRNLKKLSLLGCQHLHELPELPPNVHEIWIRSCESLRAICSAIVLRDATDVQFLDCPELVGCEEINILLGFKFLINQIKENDHDEVRCYIGPGSEIPEWINYKTSGGLLNFSLPMDDLNSSKLLGLAFAVVVETEHEDCIISTKMRIGEELLRLGVIAGIIFPQNSRNVTILFFPIETFMFDSLTNTSRNVLEVCFSVESDWLSIEPDYDTWEPASEVKVCGAHLIYDEEIGTCGGSDEP